MRELPVQTKTTDISRGGFYVEVDKSWEVGTRIECLLELPATILGANLGTIRCRGKIARVEALEEGRTGVGATIENFVFLPRKTRHLFTGSPRAPKR